MPVPETKNVDYAIICSALETSMRAGGNSDRTREHVHEAGKILHG